MSALKNTKHEAFAVARAKGMGIDEAYVAAGYATNPGNASRLNGNEKVRARVAELLERAAEKAVLSKAWVIERLMEVAERCMTAVPVLDREGNMDYYKAAPIVYNQGEYWSLGKRIGRYGFSFD